MLRNVPICQCYELRDVAQSDGVCAQLHVNLLLWHTIASVGWAYRPTIAPLGLRHCQAGTRVSTHARDVTCCTTVFSRAVFSANRFCSVALRTPPRAVRVQLEDELNPRKELGLAVFKFQRMKEKRQARRG